MRLSCGNSLNTHTLTLITHVCVIYLFFPTVWLCLCVMCIWIVLIFVVFRTFWSCGCHSFSISLPVFVDLCVLCVPIYFFHKHIEFEIWIACNISSGHFENRIWIRRNGIVRRRCMHCYAIHCIALHLLSHRISNW